MIEIKKVISNSNYRFKYLNKDASVMTYTIAIINYYVIETIVFRMALRRTGLLFV